MPGEEPRCWAAAWLPTAKPVRHVGSRTWMGRLARGQETSLRRSWKSDGHRRPWAGLWDQISKIMVRKSHFLVTPIVMISATRLCSVLRRFFS